MKRYLLLFFILTLAFTSCDGRYRALESNEKRVSKSSLSINETVKFVPEKHLKSVTDTIIDTNINVKVSYYSSPNAVVEILRKNENNQDIKTHYRAFESEIQVIKDNVLLFNKKLNKDNFITDKSAFWDKAVLQYVWLDEFESTDNDYKIYCSFLVPESKNYKMYRVHFNNLGNKTIELIETS